MRRLLLVYGTAGVVLALDQATKALAVSQLAGRPSVEVVGSFVRLTYATNPGGAFSLLAGAPLFFGVTSLLIMVGIALYARRVRPSWSLFLLGLLLGGAMGNFLDRLLRGDQLLTGEVVDFVDIGSWPIFNVADMAIVAGALLLALQIILGRHEPDPADVAAGDSAPAVTDTGLADAPGDHPASSTPDANRTGARDGEPGRPAAGDDRPRGGRPAPVSTSGAETRPSDAGQPGDAGSPGESGGGDGGL